MGISKKSSQAFTKKEYQVTNADLLNSILLSFQANGIFYVRMLSDALYDGNLSIEYQGSDLNWNDAQDMTSPSDFKALDQCTRNNGGFWSNVFPPQDPIDPFNLRVRVTKQATQGTCQIIARFL